MQTIINNTGITLATTPAHLYLRPATLYYLRIEFGGTNIGDTVGKSIGKSIGKGNNATSCGNTPLILYKLGYTTTTLQERVYGKSATYYYNRQHKRVRVAGHIGMGLPTGTIVHIISTYSSNNGSYIYQLEQELHARYKSARYCGQAVMANGNTELYTMDILQLDN